MWLFHDESLVREVWLGLVWVVDAFFANDRRVPEKGRWREGIGLHCRGKMPRGTRPFGYYEKKHRVGRTWVDVGGGGLGLRLSTQAELKLVPSGILHVRYFGPEGWGYLGVLLVMVVGGSGG